MGYRSFRAVTAVLAVTVAASAIASLPAQADRRGYSRGNYRDENRDVRWRRGAGRDRVRFVATRRDRFIVVRPAYTDNFVVRRPRFVVVRPVPYWSFPYGDNGVSARIGVRTRGFNLDLGIQKRRPAYGCDFCDDRFSSYDAWADHVSHCSGGPRGVRVIAEPWDNEEYSYYQNEAYGACERYNAPRYDRGYDRYDRGSDPGYDRRGRYNDRNRDNNDDNDDNNND